MPRLSLWFIRSAVLHLALGFTLGGLLLFHKGIPLHPLVGRLLPAHVELLLIAWTLQLAMGVAYWIFPRIDGRRTKEGMAWVAFGLLNVGVWIAGVGLVLGLPGVVPLMGRVAELAAVVAFAIHAFPRVKPTFG